MAVIEATLPEEIKKNIFKYLKKKDVIVEEFSVHPLMDSKAKYTGKVVIEILALKKDPL